MVTFRDLTLYSSRTPPLLVTILLMCQTGHCASSAGEAAFSRLSGGDPLTSLTAIEKREALSYAKENFVAREQLLDYIYANEADKGILQDPEFRDALKLPDPTDKFVLTFDDKSTTDGKSSRFSLSIGGAALVGYAVPCEVLYSIRPDTKPLRSISLEILYNKSIAELYDTIPGNKTFDVFRLTPAAISAGVQLTSATKTTSGTVAISLELPEDWNPRKESLGQFYFKGIAAGQTPIRFNSQNTFGISRDDNQTSTSVSKSLIFENTEFVVPF